MPGEPEREVRVMRRTCLIFLCFVAVQAALPKEASAWWEYIEALSGPGPLRGFNLDVRLVCQVEQVDTGERTFTTAVFPGALINLCPLPENTRRVLSFDLGVRYARRSNDPRFAGGEPIALTTVHPGVTWNFIPDDRWNFVEVGLAGGLFWFHSSGFDDFTGFVLDPRVEFHVPTRWRSRHWFLRPVVRFGGVVFPGGFTESDFAAAPGVRVHENSAKYVSFFWDFQGK